MKRRNNKRKETIISTNKEILIMNKILMILMIINHIQINLLLLQILFHLIIIRIIKNEKNIEKQKNDLNKAHHNY